MRQEIQANPAPDSEELRKGRGFVCLLVLTTRNTASMIRVGFLRGHCSRGLAQPRPLRAERLTRH
jgi:hypothetical protein